MRLSVAFRGILVEWSLRRLATLSLSNEQALEESRQMVRSIKKAKLCTVTNDKERLRWECDPALRKEFGEFGRYRAYLELRFRIPERRLTPEEEKKILTASNERGKARLAELRTERREEIEIPAGPLDRQLNEIEEAAWCVIEKHLENYRVITSRLKPPAGVPTKTAHKAGRVPSLGALNTMAQGLFESIDLVRPLRASDLGELENVVLRGLWALVDDLAMKGRPGAREKPLSELGDRGRRSRKARQK